MTDKIKKPLLARVTKRLIAMNGRSQSPTNSQVLYCFVLRQLTHKLICSQASSRLSRREQRKLARRQAREAASPDSDEQAGVSNAGNIPRKPVSRIIDLIQFLSSYDNDVGEIEHALATVQEKDQRIKSLTTTIRELKRSNNEEIQSLQAEAEKAFQSLAELEHQKSVLRDDREKLNKHIKQEKVRQTSFIQEQQMEFEKRLNQEKEKLVKANASQLERVKRDNAKLNENIRTLSEEKAQVEKTLELYIQNSKNLESQVNELNSRYPTQSLPIEY